MALTWVNTLGGILTSSFTTMSNPTGRAVGDINILHIWGSDTAPYTGDFATMSHGWTLIRNDDFDFGGRTYISRYYYRNVDESDFGGSYTFTWTDVPEEAHYVQSIWRPDSGNAARVVHSSNNPGTGTSVSSTSYDPVVTDSVLLGYLRTEQELSSWVTWPVTMTEQQDSFNTPNGSASHADEVIVTGDPISITVTTSSSATVLSLTVILISDVHEEFPIHVTQFGVAVEIAAQGVYLTQFGVTVEIEEVSEDVSTYAVRRSGGRALHTRLPDEITGYALDPAHSWWSVVAPEATENLVINPSFEDGTTGYTIATLASSSVVTGDAIGATRGAYALQFANTASVQGGVSRSIGIVPAGAYTFSLDVYVPRIGAKLIVRLSAATTADKTYTFTRAGWQRVENTIVTLASGAITVALISPVENTVSYTFRTDGWQAENKRYATSYADGDMTGWFDTSAAESYYWTGVPHASTTVRKANTGTGGRVYYFSDLVKGVDFQTTAIVGAGMGPVELDTVRVGYEKEVHKGVRFTPRDFTIAGRVIGCSYEELYQARQALISYLRPNRTLRRQPLILRYQVTDALGREASLPLEIIASYTDGLRGNITNLYQEAIGLQFHASVPYWMEEFGSAIDLGATPYESLTSNQIVYRDADGVYQNLGVGATNGGVLTVAFDADGTPLAGGAFTTLCGDLVNRIGKWNGTDWVDIDPGGGMNGEVNVIRVIPETNVIIAGGEFTTAGGIVCLRIAYFGGGASSWTPITSVETGFSSGEVQDLVYDRYSGKIFAVGASNNGASFTYYAAIGDASWASLPNGGLASVNCILSTHDKYIWIGGNFTETVDTTIQANRVIRYNIDTNSFEALDAGFNSSVFQLLQGRDGYVYATGFFTSDGNANYDLRHVARWNGSTWEEVNTAAATSIASPERAAFDANGILWYVNDALAFSHLAYDNQYMIGWINNVEFPEPVVRPAITFGYTALAFHTNNEMLLAAAASDAAATFAPKQFTLTNSGDADALPIVILRGAQTPKFIQNLDAETGIYFRANFNIVADERLFLDFAGARPRFYSDVRPNLVRHIYTGASSLATFVLRPGENRIMLLCTDIGTPDNSLTYRQRWLSSDAVTAL